MDLASRFNRTAFSKWINSDTGRIFRVIAGSLFLVVGVIFRDEWWGVASILWSVLPLTAGSFDVCYISGALIGPLKGEDIRKEQGAKRETR